MSTESSEDTFQTESNTDEDSSLSKSKNDESSSNSSETNSEEEDSDKEDSLDSESENLKVNKNFKKINIEDLENDSLEIPRNFEISKKNFEIKLYNIETEYDIILKPKINSKNELTLVELDFIKNKDEDDDGNIFYYLFKTCDFSQQTKEYKVIIIKFDNKIKAKDNKFDKVITFNTNFELWIECKEQIYHMKSRINFKNNVVLSFVDPNSLNSDEVQNALRECFTDFDTEIKQDAKTLRSTEVLVFFTESCDYMSFFPEYYSYLILKDKIENKQQLTEDNNKGSIQSGKIHFKDIEKGYITETACYKTDRDYVLDNIKINNVKMILYLKLKNFNTIDEEGVDYKKVKLETIKDEVLNLLKDMTQSYNDNSNEIQNLNNKFKKIMGEKATQFESLILFSISIYDKFINLTDYIIFEKFGPNDDNKNILKHFKENVKSARKNDNKPYFRYYLKYYLGEIHSSKSIVSHALLISRDKIKEWLDNDYEVMQYKYIPGKTFYFTVNPFINKDKKKDIKSHLKLIVSKSQETPLFSYPKPATNKRPKNNEMSKIKIFKKIKSKDLYIEIEKKKKKSKNDEDNRSGEILKAEKPVGKGSFANVHNDINLILYKVLYEKTNKDNNVKFYRRGCNSDLEINYSLFMCCFYSYLKLNNKPIEFDAFLKLMIKNITTGAQEFSTLVDKNFDDNITITIDKIINKIEEIKNKLEMFLNTKDFEHLHYPGFSYEIWKGVLEYTLGANIICINNKGNIIKPNTLKFYISNMKYKKSILLVLFNNSYNLIFLPNKKIKSVDNKENIFEDYSSIFLDKKSERIKKFELNIVQQIATFRNIRSENLQSVLTSKLDYKNNLETSELKFESQYIDEYGKQRGGVISVGGFKISIFLPPSTPLVLPITKELYSIEYNNLSLLLHPSFINKINDGNESGIWIDLFDYPHSCFIPIKNAMKEMPFFLTKGPICTLYEHLNVLYKPLIKDSEKIENNKLNFLTYQSIFKNILTWIYYTEERNMNENFIDNFYIGEDPRLFTIETLNKALDKNEIIKAESFPDFKIPSVKYLPIISNFNKDKFDFIKDRYKFIEKNNLKMLKNNKLWFYSLEFMQTLKKFFIDLSHQLVRSISELTFYNKILMNFPINDFTISTKSYSILNFSKLLKTMKINNATKGLLSVNNNQFLLTQIKNINDVIFILQFCKDKETAYFCSNYWIKNKENIGYISYKVLPILNKGIEFTDLNEITYDVIVEDPCIFSTKKAGENKIYFAILNLTITE